MEVTLLPRTVGHEGSWSALPYTLCACPGSSERVRGACGAFGGALGQRERVCEAPGAWASIRAVGAVQAAIRGALAAASAALYPSPSAASSSVAGS